MPDNHTQYVTELKYLYRQAVKSEDIRLAFEILQIGEAIGVSVSDVCPTCNFHTAVSLKGCTNSACSEYKI